MNRANPELVIFNKKNFRQIQQLQKLDSEVLDEIEVVANVLPFRVNNFVINELINWDDALHDPIFKLTFPQKDMLTLAHYQTAHNAVYSPSMNATEKAKQIYKIQMALNPNSSAQKALNVPVIDGKPVPGIQHKYAETVLFFPAAAQTCHSYCTFCFRWPQFIGKEELKFSAKHVEVLLKYLRNRKEVTDLLITGGDPMIVTTRHLMNYLEPLLHADFDHIKNIRIGTKSLTYWPYRFTHGKEADELLILFERLILKQKHVAIMANYSHVNELKPEICRQAIARILSTGSVIRSQSPVLRHINDNAIAWSELWKEQVKLGIVPYYMFVERDTGANNYFELPLQKCLEIYNLAMKNVSGLCKTARGPVMSATPGKVELLGTPEIQGEKVFLLRFIQARNTDWLNKPFFAKYDDTATWFDHLKPAFNENSFFFE